jgi:hypothetical protein
VGVFYLKKKKVILDARNIVGDSSKDRFGVKLALHTIIPEILNPANSITLACNEL